MENTRCSAAVAGRWVAVIAYAALLFYLSSLTRPPIPHFAFSDKVLHLVFYAGFGMVFVWALDPLRRGWSGWRIVFLAGLGAFVYGLMDEFHQRFVLGRTPELADLASDALGGFLGGGIYRSLAYVLRFRRKGKIEADDPAVASL